MQTVEVCLTPDLIHQHDLNGKIVVVIDIFRATSCIVTGIAAGASFIKPVMTVEECLDLGKKGMIMAGERGGQKIKEFDMGNSPLEYQELDLKDKEIAISTTNGTRAIELSKTAYQILIGSFLNITATAEFIQKQNKSVVLHCAGWKGTPNIEDTLYAGALIDKLKGDLYGDSAVIARDLFLHNKTELITTGQLSGHAKRLAGLGITRDIAYCINQDLHPDLVVGLVDNKIVKL